MADTDKDIISVPVWKLILERIDKLERAIEHLASATDTRNQQILNRIEIIDRDGSHALQHVLREVATHKKMLDDLQAWKFRAVGFIAAITSSITLLGKYILDKFHGG